MEVKVVQKNPKLAFFWECEARRRDFGSPSKPKLKSIFIRSTYYPYCSFPPKILVAIFIHECTTPGALHWMISAASKYFKDKMYSILGFNATVKKNAPVK